MNTGHKLNFEHNFQFKSCGRVEKPVCYEEWIMKMTGSVNISVQLVNSLSHLTNFFNLTTE